MKRRTTLSLVAAAFAVAGTGWSQLFAQSPAGVLDGRSFDGELRGTGLLRLVGDATTLRFRDGIFVWSTGSDFSPAPYYAVRENGHMVFTARADGKADGPYRDDHVLWRGVYDGESVSDVTAVWMRSEEGGDWWHDLLLPRVVTFVFEPDE